MKTRNLILSLAAMALLAGCAKEVRDNQPEFVSGGKTFLKVGIETKTYMDAPDGSGSRKVYWSNGDQIAVNGTPSDALTDIAEGTASTTFSFDGVLSTPYNIIYPASIYTDATHVTLPAVQAYKADGFADGMNPMAGYSADGSSISLSHLCAILKISILRSSATPSTSQTPPDTDNIVAVRFKGRGNEQVSGSFSIDYENATISGSSSADGDKEVKVVKSQATSTSTAAVYYLVVPAGTYSNGFDVIVQDVNGHIMTKSKTTSKTLEAGHLYAMGEFEFVPTGTELGIEISSAQELIDFATAYNNKEYTDLGSSLIATVTADITFDATSSAAFNATGGIGTPFGGDNYFNGVFNGNNKTISGLEAVVPLFGGTGDNGTVKNLTLDETCTYTFTHTDGAEGMFASVVGYHKGVLDNVKVAANINVAAVDGITKMTTVGGLTGRTTTGKLQNGCEYSGLISTPAGFTTTGKLIIGGLVGRFSNAGSITDCNFKGAISNAAQVTSTDKSNPYLIIGGVVGQLDGGASVTSCNSTADHAAVASAHASLSAVIVNKTTVAYHSAVGGIVGEVIKGTILNCTNAATIGNSIFRGGDGTGRYIKSGGIVGTNRAEGVITECINNGSVIHRSNPRIQTLGGIAGYNAGRITACTNNAPVRHETSGQSIAAARSVNLGGVIGENYADNMVSDVHNTANIEISSMEEVSSAEERLGGVIGYNEGIVVGGASKDITNSGEVYHSPNFSIQFAGYYLGGIVGYTKAAIKNAKNVGRTCFRWQGTYIGAGNVHLGGIVGKAAGAESTIENCDNIVDSGVTNSAQVYLYLPGNAGHNTNYVGGIVGLSEAADPVKNCINGGEVRTAAGASTVPVTGIMMGGIIGKMTGSGEVDNADNSGRVRINFGDVAEAGNSHHGNYLGGIIGYITNDSAVTVTDCDNSGNVDSTNGAGLVEDIIVSGVVGRMDASGSIVNCKNNGGQINMAITANNVGPKNLYTAGILGYSANDVVVSGCANTGNILGGNGTRVDKTPYYTGGIVAYLKGTSKILNCSNTGSTVSNHAGNNDTIGQTALTGGIAGYVEGTNDNPIEIGGTSGCTVNTTAELSSLRGWIGGVAAYAKYAQISKCTVESIIGGGCAARGAGGIVGKAEYCSISSSSYKGDQIKANQIQAGTGEGGIVGNLDNSTIDGCSCYATKFYNNNSQPFGCIVGRSISNNTIQNCHYKASVEGPTAGAAATAQVAGSGTFSGGGNAADL